MYHPAELVEQYSEVQSSRVLCQHMQFASLILHAIGNFLIKFTPKVSKRYVCIFCSLTRSLFSISLSLSFFRLSIPRVGYFYCWCNQNMPAKLSGYLCTLHQQQQKSKKKRIRRKKRRQHCDRHSHKSIYTCNTCIVRRRVRIEWAVSRVLLLTLPKFRWQILLQTLTDTHTRHSWIQLACFLFLFFV